MLDDRDAIPWYEEEDPQAVLAAHNQETRDSIRGTNNYNPHTTLGSGEWPIYPEPTDNVKDWAYGYRHES